MDLVNRLSPDFAITFNYKGDLTKVHIKSKINWRMKGRIFISEPGIVCCAGMNKDELWSSLVNGKRTGMKEVQVRGGKKIYAASLADFPFPPSDARFDMRIIRLENAALEQISTSIEKAIAMYGKERVAVCVGSCDNGTEFSVAGHESYFSNGGFPENYSLEMQGADYVATYIEEKYGISGPVMAFATACSSSAASCIKASQLIQSGIVDAAIVGGVDIASDTALLGFDSLEAISPEPTNPFSKNRRGITLGDGAAFFVLSKEPLSNEGPQVVLCGYGESCDAHHMTSPASDGKGAASAMKNALKNAELEPSKIGYINLHGTGTQLNDSMESKAVDEVFGGLSVPCSSTKSITGHTLGAAGALEASICRELIKRQSLGERNLPSQVWDGERDEDLPELNFISGGQKISGEQIRYCMSNSFAFGGSNVSLILGLEEGDE